MNRKAMPNLRNFEAMDLIHDQMKQKVDNGIVKVEPLIKKQLRSLYYDRKVSLYLLTKEKKIKDNKDFEKILQKTRKHINPLTQEEEELKKLIADYNISVSGRKLPYSMKIKQICSSISAFHRYKRDQRDVLDFSIMKSKEYQEEQQNHFLNMRILVRAECFGEKSLTEKERIRYEQLLDKEINLNIYDDKPMDELIKK